jgi:ribokinase
MNTAAGRVIVVGSVNLDLVMRVPRLPAAGETVLGGTFSRHHGGKGANQAVAAARAGALVHLVGAVGAADGQGSLDALAADGVGVQHVLRCHDATGCAFVLVDERTAENQIAVASGANATLPPEHVRTSLTALRPTPADVLVLSFELPAAPLRAAAELAAWTGTRLLVNPAPAAPDYSDLLTGAISTPNAGELAALTSAAAQSDPRAAAAVLARRTGAPVAVTLGADGALLVEDTGRAEHFPAHRVQVADTTGAGDTLTGVLAASLADGLQLRAGLRRAVAAAALAVTKPGAREAMPTATGIDELLARG